MEYITNKEKMLGSLYLKFKDDIYRLCLYYTNNEAAAEDLTQKTFFNYYTHMSQANLNRSRAYLIRTARNLSYNYTRDENFILSEGNIHVVQGKPEGTVSAEELLIRKEEKEDAYELSKFMLERLREINEDWYEAIYLAYCLEKPQDLVAEELGVTKEVLYSRLYRAKQWLRRTFKEEYKELKRR